MAVGGVRRAHDESDIELAFPDLARRFGRTPFHHGLLNVRVSLAILASQVGKESGGDGGMQADAETPDSAVRDHARRPDGVIQMLDSSGNFRDEDASSLCQPDTPMAALEKQNAQVFFQRFDARAVRIRPVPQVRAAA